MTTQVPAEHVPVPFRTIGHGLQEPHAPDASAWAHALPSVSTAASEASQLPWRQASLLPASTRGVVAAVLPPHPTKKAAT
jgi:hypothetical protein